MRRKRSRERPVRDLAILTQTDLELIVQYEEQDPPVLIYRLEVQNPLLGLVHEKTSRKRIRSEAFSQIESLFKTIGTWPSPDDPDNRAKSIRRLGSMGADLFRELVPEKLGDKLRRLALQVQEGREAQNAPVTLQIHSNETFIPWELLKFPSDDGQGPYLVEAFALTRWLDGCTQVLQLPLFEIALVVTDSGLETAKQEGEFVRSLKSDDRNIVDLPARTNDIVDHLASGRADALHITGHGLARGDNPNLWTLQLEAGDELHAYDLRDGTRRFGQKLPLIFANACHSGRGALGLNHTGGRRGLRRHPLGHPRPTGLPLHSGLLQVLPQVRSGPGRGGDASPDGAARKLAGRSDLVGLHRLRASPGERANPCRHEDHCRSNFEAARP